jgi:hypothetical protein
MGQKTTEKTGFYKIKIEKYHTQVQPVKFLTFALKTHFDIKQINLRVEQGKKSILLIELSMQIFDHL